MPPDSVNPHVISISPASPTAGQSVTFTVTFTGACSASDAFEVSSSSGSAFPTLPTSITPGAGATSYQFTAAASSTFSGSVTVTVTGPTANAGIALVVASL